MTDWRDRIADELRAREEEARLGGTQGAAEAAAARTRASGPRARADFGLSTGDALSGGVSPAADTVPELIERTHGAVTGVGDPLMKALLVPEQPWEVALAGFRPLAVAGKAIGMGARGVGALQSGALAGGIASSSDEAEAGVKDRIVKALFGGGKKRLQAELLEPEQAAYLPSRSHPGRRSTEIPEIRTMPVDEAIAIARRQPHLIKSGEGSEGAYVGAPPGMTSRAHLYNQRKAFDNYLAADAAGGDWYDRYRRALNMSTGGDPLRNLWASAHHGQSSAGVSPEAELQFVLKETNSALAGMPVAGHYGAQLRAHLAALASRDTSPYQLADKTSEYARLINPNQSQPPGATGVNDFRHALNWSYPRPETGLTPAQHKFMDYETALAVDRANFLRLGGRSDWTGEQLQAAPWVRQKALDIMERNPKLTYQQAFERANTTIGDFYPKHTMFATHEAQPGFDVTGHMPRGAEAARAVRERYARDPRSSWATAPMGRDAIYSGLGVEGTGSFMRVLPSRPMQGMYRRPDGTLETNLGEVARPLGAFETASAKGEPFKSVPPAERALMNAGEAVRAYLDAQNAGAWHTMYRGGPAKESTSLFFPRPGRAALSEMFALERAGAPHGLSDVVDTGQGMTLTRFGDAPEGGKAFDKALRAGEFGAFGPPERVRVDSDLVDYVNKWKQGEGSGAATRHMLEYVNRTPEIRAAFNNNADIAERALARLTRDEDYAKEWGVPRIDIQNARRLIGEGGRGWVDRLEAALKDGRISLPAVAAIYAAAASAPGAPSQREAPREGL